MNRHNGGPLPKTVQVGRATVSVRIAGSGPPLLYLHGAFAYAGWPPFLDRLAQRYTVYAPLHPGFGELPGIEHIDSLLEVVLHHVDLLDELGLDQPSVVGHFFGAMIAAELAAIAGHRVRGLVLAAPAGIWLDDHPGVDFFATNPPQLRSILYSDPESEIAHRWTPDPRSGDEAKMQAVERVRSLSTVAKFLWPIPDKGLVKRLGRIKCPALVVVAGHDQLVPPEHGREIASRIDGAQLQIVAGAGHMLPLEQSSRFAQLVEGFLAS